MNIFICHSSTFGPLEDTVRLCEDNRFGLELSDFSRIDALHDSSIIRYAREQMEKIIHRAIHGPYLGIDPVSKEAMTRNTSIRCYQKVYDIAVALQINHIILHPAYNPDVFSPHDWIEEMSIFWSNFLIGKSPDVRFHLENVMDAGPEMLLQLVSQVNQLNLDINLDIGHVHVYSKSSLSKWISTLGNKIGYVHLHDNHGKEDEHLGLGRGNAPLLAACRQLHKQSPRAVWAVEAGGTGTMQSLYWLHEHGFISHEIVA